MTTAATTSDPTTSKTYRLNQTGRWIALGIAAGTLGFWLFALWQLPNVLSSDAIQVSYLEPGTFVQAIDQGLNAYQIVPALLLIVLIVAAPLLIWNVAEEWSTTYTVRDDGLIYDTIQGIRVLYPWSAIKSLRLVDPEAREPVHELIVDQRGVLQIRSRILRWLHAQAFGRSRVPIYAHITDRDDLIDEITRRAGLAVSDRDFGL